MAYTTIDDPSAYFQTTLYTGNGGTQSITNGGNSDLQPDWVWIKVRNQGSNHHIEDSVRGATKVIKPNITDAETTVSTAITGFNSDGFAIGSNSDINNNTSSYVSWNWKAGGSASSNSDGSITSSVSANTTAGFSIVSYTGNVTAGATVGHGLSSVPKMIIVKNRDTAFDFPTYHSSIGGTKHLRLNTTTAAVTSSTRWNDTNPTSSVFTLGANNDVNASGDNMIAYCFSEVKSFSKFGSYTGNGSDTQFIYTGFAPAFVLWKNTNESDNHWCIIHNKAETFNGTYGRTSLLRPNDSGAEIDGVSNTRGIDFLSNGFCLRSWAGSTGTITANESGDKYIYMAFAENPFVTSTGVPATAK